ncbi:MAG: HAMP domain-containing sensor histidine kinase [Myxococcota bacterium]
MGEQGEKASDPRVLGLLERIGASIHESAEDLAKRWLRELRNHLNLEPVRVFPQETLLNHIPLLLRRVADAVSEDRDLTTDSFVLDEIGRLAELRVSQGYTTADIATEFDLLGEVILEHISVLADEEDALPGGLVVAIARLNRTLVVIRKLMQGRMRELRTSRTLRSDEEINSFGRAVSHELRNRLNVCQLTLSLLRNSPEAERADVLTRLSRSLDRVTNVVGDVFAMATMRGTDPDGVERDVLATVVTDVATDSRDYADTRGVEIRVGQNLPQFWVDESRLRMVLINLVGNSIKYSDPSKSKRWVVLEAHKHDEHRRWEVEVRDNGLGIRSEELAHIFDPGVRGGDPSAHPGEGLGLTLAYTAAEQLGGKLTVDSREGEGTSFRFSVFEPLEALP